MEPLDAVADRQATLSQTADALKKKVDRARRGVLLLSVLGAAAAGIAAALSEEGPLRHFLTIVGTACLFVASALIAALLGAEERQRPVRFRAGSETLKREAFLFATGAGDYGGADRNERLLAALARVDEELGELIGHEVERKDQGRCPRTPLDRETYCEQRVKGQIQFYRQRAGGYSRSAARLHVVAWLFSLAAGAITALSGLIGPTVFDLAAVTGILTTVAAAFMSHIQANKYDELVISYRSAARALERLQAAIGKADTAASIADRAEPIIAEETGSWRAMFLQDAAPVSP